ncbi:hypothetical protein Csp2054_15090 [Curtobacterium sp. 'Ferrero']|nr:hypothetical protein Csp2054_15090 [Curtobacterium sp. 'Ferrero']
MGSGRELNGSEATARHYQLASSALAANSTPPGPRWRGATGCCVVRGRGSRGRCAVRGGDGRGRCVVGGGDGRGRCVVRGGDGRGRCVVRGRDGRGRCVVSGRDYRWGHGSRHRAHAGGAPVRGDQRVLPER